MSQSIHEVIESIIAAHDSEVREERPKKEEGSPMALLEVVLNLTRLARAVERVADALEARNETWTAERVPAVRRTRPTDEDVVTASYEEIWESEQDRERQQNQGTEGRNEGT